MIKALRCLLGIVMFCLGVVQAAPLPGVSAQYLPVLGKAIDTHWPTIPNRTFPAGIIDQESNWKQYAQLKTSRERGCGLGQFTIAYDKNGKMRFDSLGEIVQNNSSLRGWNWSDCYNATYQLNAVVLKLHSSDRDCSIVMDKVIDRMACNAAKYNGGAGSIAKRIRSCRLVKDCNPKIWFDNLEKQCPQGKTKVAGYGESFCDINSKYPKRVFTRMVKFDGKL